MYNNYSLSGCGLSTLNDVKGYPGKKVSKMCLLKYHLHETLFNGDIKT